MSGRYERRLESAVSAARSHVGPAWTEADAVRLGVLARARARRRAVARGLGVSALAAVALVLGVTRPWAARTEVAEVAAPDDGVIRLADGSTVTPLEAGTVVVVDHVEPGEVVLELRAGVARFDVARNPSRAFIVLSGEVSVHVIGTHFVVRRLEDGTHTSVEVEGGRVGVEWPSGRTELGAGESGAYPPTEVTEVEPATTPSPVAVALVPTEPVEPAAPSPTERRPRVPDDEPVAEVEVVAAEPERPAPPHASWEALADEGRFDEAYELLSSDTTLATTDDVGTLLHAADTARLAGEARTARGFLERACALAEARHDPQAPLAAFQLGRLLLERLHDARSAAAAFARARELDPTHALAEDALAREVEAWHDAGDAVRAHERALEYVERYPGGSRERTVRRLGGL